MMFALREMQHSENNGFFQLEFAGHSHKQTNLNDLNKCA